MIGAGYQTPWTRPHSRIIQRFPIFPVHEPQPIVTHANPSGEGRIQNPNPWLTRPWEAFPKLVARNPVCPRPLGEGLCIFSAEIADDERKNQPASCGFGGEITTSVTTVPRKGA